MGPIASRWINEQTKLEILTVIKSSQQQGVSARRSCAILVIEHRRIVRWQQRTRQGLSLANLTLMGNSETSFDNWIPEEYLEKVRERAFHAMFPPLPGRSKTAKFSAMSRFNNLEFGE